jgi:glycine cleavage system H protein
VSAVNEGIADSPERVNQDPYGEGWLFELHGTDDAGTEFLDADAYRALVE